MLIANDFINELPAGEPEETKDMKVSFMYHLTGKYRRNCFGINHS
jgi:hypothetical protein